MSKSDDYPRLWQLGLIQAQVRKRANHRCEQCGIQFKRGTNIAVTAKNSAGKPIIGTVHHIDMDKQNCSMRNLVYLCQSCHTRVHGLRFVPGGYLPKVWINRVPDWITKRKIQFKQQLTLFEEI